MRRHADTRRRSDSGKEAAGGSKMPAESANRRHNRRSRLAFVTTTLLALSLVSVTGIQPAAAEEVHPATDPSTLDLPCVAIAKTPYYTSGALVRFSGYASCPQPMQQLIIRVKGWWKLNPGSTNYHQIANAALNCGSGQVRCPSAGNFNVYGSAQPGCKIYWTNAIATYYYYGIPVAYTDTDNSNNIEICT